MCLEVSGYPQGATTTPGFHSRHLLRAEWIEDSEDKCVAYLRVSVVWFLMKL